MLSNSCTFLIIVSTKSFRINVLVRGLFPLKEQICQKLDELSLNHEELVLLKCISVFVTGNTLQMLKVLYSGVGYPDNALVPIIQARTKYSILLSELIQERFPQMPLSDRMRRLTDSLGLLQLSKVGLRNTKEIQSSASSGHIIASIPTAICGECRWIGWKPYLRPLS